MAEKNIQMNGNYANPSLGVHQFNRADGADSGAKFSSETSSVIKDALSMIQADPTGFNRNLNKRIKRADNIAQQTRLNIKLDKKEERQEKRAQKMLDKNPEYANRAVEKSAQANAKQAMLEQIVSNPLLPINKTK